MKKVFSVLAMFSMVGCSAVPITTETINEAGEATTKTTGYVKDASVAKEHEVHETLRNRDREYGKAYKQSGFKMEFALVDVGNGLKVYLPKEISFKETPRFEQKLPTEPSKHPMWNTFDKLLDNGLYAFGIGALLDFGKTAVKEAGNTYQGDLTNSGNVNNATGENSYVMPYEVRPEVVEPTIVHPTIVPAASSSSTGE